MGLALFTITALKVSLSLDSGILAATICGLLTGVGGGVIRDVLANRVPYIFKKELYTISAATGAIFFLLTNNRLHEPWHSLASMFLIVILRYSALTFNLRLPIKAIK